LVTRRRAILGLGATALIAPFVSRVVAQAAKSPRRIAILSSTSDSDRAYLNAFREALKSLGYGEGQEVAFDIRWADNRLERLPALAKELLSLNPAVIVTHGSAGVAACQKATSTVPIVFASAGDPVQQGFIKSYHYPGGNITGIAFNEDINKKQYELIKDVFPKASRIATFINVSNPAQRHQTEDLPQISKDLRFESVVIHVTKESELEAGFEQAVNARAHALVVGPIAPFIGLRSRLVELQLKFKIPSFMGWETWVQAGGLGSYSFPAIENWRRAAALVDKILNGVSPAEIPVEIPVKYEVAINLKTAKALGINVPKTVLLRADRVIE
jgi:putative ABC transport system substrate-binding protein